ncbi:putative PurR-regulated permease PerM [Bacillus ectoiniformans]|uniref:AI-2E family transporter n=1 Tax=Bacillus ectoiniformans TaxID=1494429 RepID=UPI0019562935|nr:AI-2E family transporter [Bacillus ectoiniformans]MBM7649020.1 putative PurR-regulated permease PerM [Bacillus ectoiniformans]
MESNLKLRWLYIASAALVTLLFIYVLFLLRPLLMPVFSIVLVSLLPFLLGGFIAYLLHPLVEKIIEQGFTRTWAILFIYFLFFGAAGYAVYKGTPLFIHQLRDLSASAPELSALYEKQMTALQDQTVNWPDGLQEELRERIRGFEVWLTGLFETMMNLLMKAVNFLLVLAVVPFISFYLLKDIRRVKKVMWKAAPIRWRRKVLRFVKELDNSLGCYIRGQLIVCLLTGGIAALLFYMIGLRYPILLGVIIGATNVIPYFGPIIGAVPAVFIALTMSPTMAIYTAIIVFALQFLEGNLLSPWIMGRSLHLHPLVIIGALLLGGEAGGIPGLIFAVPILIFFKAAFFAEKRAKAQKPKAAH